MIDVRDEMSGMEQASMELFSGTRGTFGIREIRGWRVRIPTVALLRKRNFCLALRSFIFALGGYSLRLHSVLEHSTCRIHNLDIE